MAMASRASLRLTAALPLTVACPKLLSPRCSDGWRPMASSHGLAVTSRVKTGPSSLLAFRVLLRGPPLLTTPSGYGASKPKRLHTALPTLLRFFVPKEPASLAGSSFIDILGQTPRALMGRHEPPRSSTERQACPPLPSDVERPARPPLLSDVGSLTAAYRPSMWKSGRTARRRYWWASIEHHVTSSLRRWASTGAKCRQAICLAARGVGASLS